MKSLCKERCLKPHNHMASMYFTFMNYFIFKTVPCFLTFVAVINLYMNFKISSLFIVSVHLYTYVIIYVRTYVGVKVCF